MAFTFGPRLQLIQYGLLYNWYAVNDGRGIAPDGWSVATDAQWTTLVDYLGGASTAGGALKSTELWNSPNTGATNSSGFSALPGGFRIYNGNYYTLGNFGLWWSATESIAGEAWNRRLAYDNTNVDRNDTNKEYGFSVRCVRDTQPPAATVTDVTGNVYTWVKIGSQYWLAQNLATTKYNNGDTIEFPSDNAAWQSAGSANTGAAAYPNGDSTLVK